MDAIDALLGDVQIFCLNGTDPHFSAYYSSNYTIHLDSIFELNDMPLIDYGPKAQSLRSSICAIRKHEVEKVLGLFVELAVKNGSFVGVREDEFLRAYPEISQLYLSFSTSYTGVNGGPYLFRKNINGHNVLFPANL